MSEHVEITGIHLQRGSSQPGVLEAFVVTAAAAHLEVVPTTSRQDEPVYANKSDFYDAACAYGHMRGAEYATNAWRGIARVAIAANNEGYSTPLVFQSYPETPECDRLRDVDSFDGLEVGSLAVFVQTIESQVNLRDGRVGAVDTQIAALLPKQVGAAYFRFWKTFARHTLAGERYPKVI